MVQQIRSNQDANNSPLYNTFLIGVGGGLTYNSRDLLLGRKTLYHGTSKENWEDIKRNGLIADKGGTGAAKIVGDQNYMKSSKGYVHATTVAPYANMYANMPTLFDKLKGRFENSKAMSKMEKLAAIKDAMPAFLTEGQGKRVKIDLPYDQYERMQIDTDGGDHTGRWKGIAVKGQEDIKPEHIIGTDDYKAKKRDWSAVERYMKNHTGRFGFGVGLAGFGIASIGTGLHGLLNND